MRQLKRPGRNDTIYLGNAFLFPKRKKGFKDVKRIEPSIDLLERFFLTKDGQFQKPKTQKD